MKKRLVAFLLVLIMVLGMLPVSAMAAGSVVTARGSAENPIRIYENSGNQAETSNGSVQVPVGETVTDSGVLTFSTYSAIEGVQVSKGGVYCAVTSSNENVVKATGSWSGGVLTINFLGVGNGTAKITVDYTCTCSKNAVAKGLLIYNVTVGDGGSTDPSGKPNAPTASDIGAFPDAGKAVLLHCVDAGARGHDATASSLNKVQNGYSVGEVVENPGTYYNVDGGKITKEQFPWMCVVTVHAAPFIELYNSNFSERYGVHKLAGTSNATATLHWFWHNTYGWQYLENPPIQFNITWDTSEKTYTLNYYKNTTDTVTNMPEPNPQTETSSTGTVTFNIPATKPTREGYNFLGWAGNPDATEPTVKPGNTVTTTATVTKLYAVWEKNDSPVPDNPGGTKPDVANAQVKICVQCIEDSATHQPKNYGILPGAYVDSLLQVDGTYYYSITLNRAKYIEKFGQDSDKTHTDTEPNESIQFTWQWKNGKWELISDIAPVIKVKCDTTTKPSKPALNEGSPVLVQCVQAGTHTDSGKDSAKKYFALGGYAYRYEEVKKEGSNVWKDEADNKWTYQLKLKRDEFVKAYNNLSLVTTHTDTNPGEETYVTWKHDGTSWKLVPAAGQTSAGIGAVINVKCTPVPTSDEPTLANTDLNLIVKCVTNNAAHSERSMPLKAGTFKMIGTVQDRGPLKFCTIEVETAQYVAAFDTGHPGTHTAAKTIRVELYLKKNDSTAKWTNNKSATDNVIEVTCEPKAPTADELKKLEMAVQVKCVVDASQQHTAAYGLLGECDVDYFVFEPRQEGDDWLCDISYYPERYVAEFNTTFQNLKHVQNDEKIVPVTLIWAGGSWQIKTQGRVHVTEEYTVTYTDGVDGEEVFADQVYSDLRKDSTTPAFNGTPTRTGYTFAGWEPEVAATVTQTVTYVAKWEAKKANVHLMIFKSGDLSKPIVDVPYAADKIAGDTIDLTKIDPSSYLDFDFEIDGGWYDDGMFNSYKRYLDGLQDKPAGLEKLLITGNWQNLKLIVTELVPVVYFDSLESLTAYQNDHSKTEGILRTTKARVGSALPTADAPTATRDGYTFTFWSREGQTVDVTDQTVNGWTNLYANWKVTPHNIYAFARLNSAFAPLTSVEFGEFVKLNDATLTRLGLGNYNANNYISIGTFSFNKLPLMGDDFMSYYGDEEFDAVVAELADNIVLETGVSKEVAEKIAWTYLFKADNSDYMTEAGYPTDDENGYQLSGNLNLATVMFEANGENVTGMPAVNYTYDDILEIHDFYFAGDTFTMPADPTREGYSFEGWSVKVLPDENDADHLDADGADDAADETLLKAGDTYTITAGGVIFTAQWEKKTFTVKYYLPDETGAWVEKKMDTVDSVDYATYSLWTPDAEDGYEFSGWYQKTADIGVKAKVEKLYMAKEWKLYGKFTPIEYTIQYVYNDGKATSTNPTTYTVESDTITLADATGADWGKTFLEWHDENGQKITEIPTGSTGDRVITAYWNWPVHLHYLDKDNNEIESATLYVSELEPGACVLPTGEKTGYDFDGWYEAKKDIGTASHKLNALSIAKKWELYGRYTAKTDVSYTVKYLREGDNKVLAPEKVVTDQTFDTEVTEQAADVVGYTPDAPSKTMILDEYNKVLTFSYSANTYDYTVRHIKQLPDGSYDEANAEVETLSGKFEALAAVTAKDYGSHYPTNDADTKQNIKIEEGLTIDVKYDLDEHTLTFETNGGSAINPVTVRHGNAVARPADPTKDKYTFIGWYADPEFTEEYDFATVLEADKTIYAKFELTSTPIGDIYVRYDVLHIKQLPDGTYDLANAEVEHLSAKKDTTVTAVIKDYRATHHVNVNRTLSKLTGTAIQPYKGVDGKPVYTILSVYYDLDFHTLTFDTMGGSKIAPETVRHGLTVAKPKDPVNGGYIFDGWYTDKTFRHRYDFSTPLTEDITIYAKWFLIVLPGVTVKKNTPKLNTADHFAYVQGYPDGTVKPAGNITRAETAAILFRLMDDASRKTYYSTKSGFRDVASGSWYNTYVATLNNAGVITDSSNGYFRPNEAITRAELAAMLAKFSETTGAANYFNDVSAKYWAANAIAICAKLGWITGYPDGTFRPDKNVTRAELMAMINRATGRAPKSADAFLPGMKTWSDNTSDKWYYLDVQEATNSHSYTVKGSETWTALTSDPNWSLYE